MQVLTRRYFLYFKKMIKLQISSPSSPFKVVFWQLKIIVRGRGGGEQGVSKKILILKNIKILLHRDYYFSVFRPNTYHQVEQALKLTRQKRWNLLLCWVLFQTNRPAWNVARCNLPLCDLLSLFDQTEVEEKQDTSEKATVSLNACWEQIAEVVWNSLRDYKPL